MRPRNVTVVGQGDEHEPLPDEGVVRVETPRSPYEDLGARVAGVLAAAEQAAAQMKDEAETEAEQVRREADEYAKEVRAAVEEEARRGTLKFREDTRALEERRQRVLDELREIAATLEDIAQGGAAGRVGAPESIANARSRRRSR